jgi:DNA primase
MASIEEAKNIIKDTPISSVINFYYPITKRGADYKGVCPFHKDTKPSMSVSDSKGVYKCFACGAAGDAIKFVQDFKNLDFIESVKDIAGQLSIPIDEFNKKEKNPKFDMGFRVLNVAYKIYKKVANELKPKQFTDFVKNRNLNEESVSNFGICYAPSDNAISTYLNSIPNPKDREFALKLAKEIGIIGDSNRGAGQYDFFRDRIVFPIWDHGGQIRGFQCRATTKDAKAKYMNSRESFIFDKGNILYGFNIAKNQIRQKNSVIVCEGNMDVVVLHQFGYTNSVGSMGTAFSENSARLLANMTKNIFLAMDSDAAGIQGMERMNQMLLPMGILPKYLNFEPSKDPDEFLNEFGRLELDKRIEEAPTFVDVLIEKAIPNPVPQTTDQRLECLKDIFDILAPLKDGLVAKEKAITAGQSLGLQSSKEDIIDAYKTHLAEIEEKKSKYKKAPIAKKAAVKPTPTPTQKQHDDNNSIPMPDENYMPHFDEEDMGYDNFHSSMGNIAVEENRIQNNPATIEINNAPGKAELMFLDQLISNPECLENKQIAEILDLIDHSEVKQIVEWLKNIYLEIDDADYTNFVKSKLEEDISLDIKNVIASALFNYNKLKLDKKIIEKLLADYQIRLKKEKLISAKKVQFQMQKNARTEQESIEVLKEIQKIEKELLKLKQK